MIHAILEWIDTSDKVGYILVGFVIGLIMAVVFRLLEVYFED
jgi:tetrahydromethanopterin S-methyltransferase subunit G